MSNRIDDEAFKLAIATYIDRFGAFNPFDPNFVYITKVSGFKNRVNILINI